MSSQYYDVIASAGFVNTSTTICAKLPEEWL